MQNNSGRMLLSLIRKRTRGTESPNRKTNCSLEFWRSRKYLTKNFPFPEKKERTFFKKVGKGRLREIKLFSSSPLFPIPCCTGGENKNGGRDKKTGANYARKCRSSTRRGLIPKKMEEILIYISRSLYVRGRRSRRLRAGINCFRFLPLLFPSGKGGRWQRSSEKKVLAPPFLLLLLFLSPTSRLAFWVKEERSGKSFSSVSRKKEEKKN